MATPSLDVGIKYNREAIRKPLSIKNLVKLVGVVLRWMLFVTLYFVWPVLRFVLRPKIVFLVYGSSNDRRFYCPPYFQKYLRSVVQLGFIKRGNTWGVIGSVPRSIKELVGNKERLEKFLVEARRQFPGVKKFALAGRLPGFYEREKIELRNPFVSGIRGTVYAMTSAARALAARANKLPSSTCIAVLGGAGTIGIRLVEELRREFATVIAFDPRYERNPFRGGNVVFTFTGSDLLDADVALVLTAKGDDIRAHIQNFRPGVIVADDTHPCMSSELIQKLRAQGAEVLKATTMDDQLRMFPRLPNFRHDDTPGCLLEAVVSLLTEEESVLQDQEAFSAAAEKLGFRARLAPHVDS